MIETTLFPAGPEPDEPPLRPEFVEQTVAKARRAARRGRGLGVLTAAVAAVLLVAALLPWVRYAAEAVPPSAPSGRPTLPEQFADFSAGTSFVTDRPAGRAIAYYEFGNGELFDTWQWLVAGADRDTYRRLPEPPQGIVNDDRMARLLSPDGRYLLSYSNQPTVDQFDLLDLTTGERRPLHGVTWQDRPEAGIVLLAWSPDGRYVAYAVPSADPVSTQLVSSEYEPLRDLAILDIAADTTVRYPGVSKVVAASFSPDSQRLAVQRWRGEESWFVSIRGERLGSFAVPANGKLVDNVAWSPDGALLAVLLTMPPRSPDGTVIYQDTYLGFLDATGADGPVPANVFGSYLLGWRTPGEILLLDPDLTRILRVDLATGTRHEFSRFSTAQRCEYFLNSCHAWGVQLATGLLANIEVRPGAPDGGPWANVPERGIPLLLMVLVVVGVWLLVRRLRRRRPSG